MTRTLTIILLFLALIVSPLASASPVSAASCATYHTVLVGENLFRIGLKYGLAWPVIATANGLVNSDMIWAGQVLCIPAILPAITLGPTKTPAPVTPTLTPTRTATPTPTIAGSGGGAGPTPTANFIPAIVPTFFITGVVRDTSVSISASNFPPNTTFDVLMGPYGSLGVNGTKVGTQASGTGVFTATYTIPANLKGSAQIAIRLQSVSGYFSFNWFFN